MQTVKDLIEELQKYPENLAVVGLSTKDNISFWSAVEIKKSIGFSASDDLNTVSKTPVLLVSLTSNKNK